MPALITPHASGLYCAAGDFYVDPWRPVERAVITHAHADHARGGHTHYLAPSAAAHVLRARLGDITLDTLDYGEAISIGDVKVSLWPAGHVLGSCQVRIEHRGEVWVVSGDYKLEPDPTCVPFAPVRCHTFITESTFGLPIYRWPSSASVMGAVNAWWAANAAAGRASVVYAYAFGKAQRILAGLDASIGPIVVHGAVESLNRAYRASGIALPDTFSTATLPDKAALARAIVVAPPSAQSSRWLDRFGAARDGFASGWMQLRGARRRRAVDRGFVLSDHADWPALNEAIRATGAERVFVTHGQVHPMVRWLGEQGLDAHALGTEFAGELDETGETGDPVERTANAGDADA